MRSASQQVEQMMRMATLLRGEALPPAAPSQLRQPSPVAPAGRMSQVYWGVALGWGGPGTRWAGDVHPCDGPGAANVNTSITLDLIVPDGNAFVSPAVYPEDYPDSGDAADVVPFVFSSGGDGVLVGGGYYSPAVGSIRWWPYADDIPRGWVDMDGTANASPDGSGVDMRGRLPLNPGSFGGVIFAAEELGGCVYHRHSSTHRHNLELYTTSFREGDGDWVIVADTDTPTTEYETVEVGNQQNEGGDSEPNPDKLPVPYGVPGCRLIERLY